MSALARPAPGVGGDCGQAAGQESGVSPRGPNMTSEELHVTCATPLTSHSIPDPCCGKRLITCLIMKPRRLQWCRPVLCHRCMVRQSTRSTSCEVSRAIAHRAYCQTTPISARSQTVRGKSDVDSNGTAFPKGLDDGPCDNSLDEPRSADNHPYAQSVRAHAEQIISPNAASSRQCGWRPRLSVTSRPICS